MFSIGNGRKVDLWNDKWIEQAPLKQLYPDIYSINQQQNSTIEMVWGEQGWNLSFRRALNDWEIDRLASFFGTLEQFKGTSTDADCLIWLRNKDNKFTVKAAYRVLITSNNQSGTWPWKMVWRVKIPHKVACFSWLLAREVVLTQDTLMRRGFNLCSRCFLCGKEAETISHLFLHCS